MPKACLHCWFAVAPPLAVVLCSPIPFLPCPSFYVKNKACCWFFLYSYILFNLFDPLLFWETSVPESSCNALWSGFPFIPNNSRKTFFYLEAFCLKDLQSSSYMVYFRFNHLSSGLVIDSLIFPSLLESICPSSQFLPNHLFPALFKQIHCSPYPLLS